MKIRKYIPGFLFAFVLIAFTAFVLLDTFVIPRAYVVLDDSDFGNAATQDKISSDTSDESNNHSHKHNDSSSDTGMSKPDNSTDETTDETTDVTTDETTDETPDETTDNSSDTGVVLGNHTETAIGNFDSTLFSDTVVTTDTEYRDNNISITITQYRKYETTIYVAEIYLKSIYNLKTALADNTFGRNITQITSTMATAHDAILAINGDYYGAQEKGYVLRNGTVLRTTSADSGKQDLAIYTDGMFEVFEEGAIDPDTLLTNGALQILSFGPGLIINGSITVGENDEVDVAMASNPRTAIGYYSPLHYVFVVADGRTDESAGLSLYEMADFLQTLGVKTAYNLDGGGSSTMYFNGKIVNHPTTDGKTFEERTLSDIVYIGY